MAAMQKPRISAPVIEYVTEEVSRQGHDVTALDGIARVGWMLNGWSYALTELAIGRGPSMSDALLLGQLVEPLKNRQGWRTCGVRVGSRVCPPDGQVPDLVRVLFDQTAALKPLQFYREFELIHPFVDGNGRCGKILLAWLSGKLLNPEFPPDDFWGHPIRNP